MRLRSCILQSAAALLSLTAVQGLRAQSGGDLPFLRMETDARSAAMAGAGAALPERTFAVQGNAAVLLFGDRRNGAGLSVGPLGGSGDDRLWSAAGLWSPDERQAVTAGFRRLGGVKIPMTDEAGFPAGEARPWDLSAEAGYARRFGTRFAAAVTARYVRSDFDLGEAFQGVSFDLAAALRGGFGPRSRIGWITALRIADLGPDPGDSDGRKLRLPTRGSFEGALLFPLHRNHEIRVAADFGYRLRDNLFDASFGAEYQFLRHGVVRAGYCTQNPCGTGGHAAVGGGVIVGPVRCDIAYRFGGSEDDPFDRSLMLTLGFLL